MTTIPLNMNTSNKFIYSKLILHSLKYLHQKWVPTRKPLANRTARDSQTASEELVEPRRCNDLHANRKLN